MATKREVERAARTVDADSILRACIAELHEAAETADSKLKSHQSNHSHYSHQHYAEGIAAGLQQALDLLNKKVLEIL